MQLTRTHRILIGVVVTGAIVIAGIGFAGSYAAVRDLAHDKGFGGFSDVFPIGVDAGIVVLLALDLLLTWLRIPFPLLRQTAWLLTAATIAFNGAASWPDPLGVGMHAVIPVLFVVSVEAARHAIGRIADITADRHMESVRVARWLLAPVPTFRLWRRMKLWELRSYDEVIKIEQDRLIYRARLRARYGRAWRRKAPVESLMPLRLARYGVPLAETAEAGLAAAGIEPAPTRPALPAAEAPVADVPAAYAPVVDAPVVDAPMVDAPVAHAPTAVGPTAGPHAPAAAETPGPAAAQPQALPQSVPLPVYQPDEAYAPDEAYRPDETYGNEQPHPHPQQNTPYAAEPPYPGGQVTVPVSPGRVRNLGVPDDVPREELYYAAFRRHYEEHGKFPSHYQFGRRLQEMYGISELSADELRALVDECRERHREMNVEHIP
ncbi:DUF2637 domain-containing protein [Streptomyces sp. XD-27]|uniref:DUF2637 domain-containing protein n=1 Tax=Streptomyces sp. XD-27 TaxID=3062779 RepID=UPI0026F46D66|nr:DUF2637 domain-containing protein [Streptomyces sp. XD-27]WKX74362.1 DUF2637 domain-containing protein [Streptomyces sp. XD-27]